MSKMHALMGKLIDAKLLTITNVNKPMPHMEENRIEVGTNKSKN